MEGEDTQWHDYRSEGAVLRERAVVAHALILCVDGR